MRGSRGSLGVSRRIHHVAVVTTVLFGLTTVLPAGPVPQDGKFPISWLLSWFRPESGYAAPALATAVRVPPQPSGTAAGKEHYVSTRDTTADGGAGRAPGKGIGGLAP